MLIEKRKFDGGMNGDTDQRDLPDTDSLNIQNCRRGVTKYGRLGPLENTLGSTLISQMVRPPYGEDQTIGSAIDWEEMRLLFFNYNTVDDHGIYCYDPAANNAAGKIYAVLYDSQVIGGLGFSKNSLIHSARVNNGNLYWVDGTNNEPRRININAGIEMNLAGTFPSVDPYSYPMTQAVIRMIRRQPGLPLTPTKAVDGAFDNNFIKNEAFLFQWRYIYRDYETSTLSSFSELMNYNIATDTYNYIAVVAPLIEQIDQDVLQVDFVAKYLNGNTSFVIHSWNRNIAADLIAINAHNAGTTPLTFNFYNDFTGTALDDAYSVKPFDSLPIYAQTIEMARFRSFMGNFTIGYDTPTQTSLTAEAVVQEESGSLEGRYWVMVYHDTPSTTASKWVLYINSLGVGQDGYYYNAGMVLPLPSSQTWAGMTYIGATQTLVENFFFINHSDVLYFSDYGGANIPVSGAPAPTTLAGSKSLKSGASYQVSISFLDHSGRKSGILTAPELKINVAERAYSQIEFTTAINWFLSNENATDEIPDWAYYYSINVTKCLTTRFFLQARVKNITYATKDVNGIYVFNTAAYSPTLNGVAFDFTRLNGFGMGYTFVEGDLVKIYMGSSVYNLSIVAQQDSWVICELQNLGTLGTTAVPVTTALFEIYTPYKPSLSEPYYEVADIFAIDNPTQATRTYSILAGTIDGDITILKRNDGTADYLTENMSPNDKYPYQWNTDSGRPNFVDTLGQVVRESTIAYSNTFIPGTKVNGLSTYDALDTKDIQCGSVRKLQVANKTGEDEGDIMLAICENETASLYLGEIQLVGQATNAFVAQAPGVIGTVNVLKGGLGTTRPESVTCYRGLVFGIDLNKGIYWQYSPAGLEEVSRYKQTRFFKNYCAGYLATNNNNLDNINGFHHIRSTVNVFHKEVQVTLPALIYENYADVLPSYSSVPAYATSIVDRFDIYDQLQKTMCFSYESNVWGSNFEWISEWSEFLQDNSYCFKNGNLYLMDSNTTTWNTVFGVEYPVRVCGVANINSSLLKDLASIAVESNMTPTYAVAMANYPNVQITDLANDGTSEDFEDQQGMFYASWLMDRMSPNSSGTADEKLYTGDNLTDVACYWMLEWNNIYDALFFVDCVNLGWNASRGQQQIAKPINK